MSLLTREQLEALRPTWSGQTVGFTSGNFDILHPGHIEILTEAKRCCDVLIVGVNSDSSVRLYKDSIRPIQGEHDRASIVAALKVVDYAFIFNERSNRENILSLKPDLYIKGGEYGVGTLTSAPLVESYGGRVHLISMKSGYSTTGVINRIGGLLRITGFDGGVPEARPAAFLDRDGTLIKLVEYLSESDKVELLGSVIEGLQLLQSSGYRLVIVTNQQGIGLGYFSKEDFYKVMLRFFELVSPYGITIDKVYFSAETNASTSRWRKPATGMFEAAVRELNIQVERSFVIGDASLDMEFARNAGLPGVLVRSGKMEKYLEVKRNIEGVDYDVAPDFLGAVELCLKRAGGSTKSLSSNI
jgi:rfaE bifunctional protein nucleotidyltransferase chain/domain